ncbi:MAG: ubiquinol-cytochrome c reductase iron-sulfur subunit [Pseudomonadota bacterium]
MSDNSEDINRRRFVTGSAAVVGAIGAAFAAIPFAASFQPSARAKAIGAPVEVDVAKLEPGQRVTVKWRGKPVWILRRTSEQIESLKSNTEVLSDPESGKSVQPEYAINSWRSSNPEYLVLVGLCTHLGCSPTFMPDPGADEMGADWPGGFFCPCHGSKFDLAGRVFANVPAPKNMDVPPYRFASEVRIVIGEDEGGEA